MASLRNDEADPAVPAIHGAHTASGSGVFGESEVGPGVSGVSRGTDENHRGVGIYGKAIGTGVMGESDGWVGVFGFSQSVTGGSGVWGHSSTGGAGVVGESATGPGVFGKSSGTDPNQAGVGVLGRAIGTALLGESTSGFGVFATTETGEAAIRGDHRGDGFAGFFTGKVGVTSDLNVNGNVHVLGDVQLIGGDLAEEFTVPVGVDIEPGVVVVLAGADTVHVSSRAYDRRVAGVVSGGGVYRPGIVLDQRGGQRRWPLALAGKVWCKVDASFGAVRVGDMLTTSPTPGHAMRADDPSRCFGAVLGKALADLANGVGAIPVLVTLG